MTDLKDKAISIKGKEYVQVKDRILYLAEQEQPYSIETDYQYFPERKLWVVKAKLTIKTDNGDECVYNGLAQEIESDNYREVNHTSALENAETSAVGRACAMAGIGVLDSIASADEMHKAMNRPAGLSPNWPEKPTQTPPPAEPAKTAPAAQPWQKWTQTAGRPQKVEGETCPDCGGKYIKSKTGNIFCQNKCWLPENSHLKGLKDQFPDMKVIQQDDINTDEIPFD